MYSAYMNFKVNWRIISSYLSLFEEGAIKDPKNTELGFCDI